MYMFDPNRCYNWRYNRHYNRLIIAQIHMYIPVSHTNGRFIKNTIGVVVNLLVGMGLQQIVTSILFPVGVILPHAEHF